MSSYTNQINNSCKITKFSEYAEFLQSLTNGHSDLDPNLTKIVQQQLRLIERSNNLKQPPLQKKQPRKKPSMLNEEKSCIRMQQYLLPRKRKFNEI